MKIPDRWLNYQAIGKRIEGTQFVCFKVPLSESNTDSLNATQRFTPPMLLTQCPKLKLVIDLTNTSKYYKGEVEFTKKDVQYKKILTPGHIIPSKNYIEEFFRIVDAFLRIPTNSDSLIGVHCTHGLNRTSYFVCCYMIHRMEFEPEDAIIAFEEARGHKIERANYLQSLSSRELGAGPSEPPSKPVQHQQCRQQRAQPRRSQRQQTTYQRNDAQGSNWRDHAQYQPPSRPHELRPQRFDVGPRSRTRPPSRPDEPRPQRFDPGPRPRTQHFETRPPSRPHEPRPQHFDSGGAQPPPPTTYAEHRRRKLEESRVNSNWGGSTNQQSGFRSHNRTYSRFNKPAS